MKQHQHQAYDEKQNKYLKKARRYEYLTLAYLASVIYLMYTVMGSSQAMKTAWVEDCLSLIPPICFLIGSRISAKTPNKHYPFGFSRVVSILFMCAALALLIMGGYLFIEAGLKLYHQEHPTIGMQEFFGHDMWLGWWMILVLIWGMFPPIILGRVKMKLAHPLNDKILYTDAKMNKADWLTAAAAIGGILGVWYGLWWADALAALIISFDILRDGFIQTQDAVTGLMNRAPTEVDNGYSDLPQKVEKTLLKFDWIEKADIKLYESGHLYFGQGCIVVADDKSLTRDALIKATEKVRKLDWRLREFAITLDCQDKI